MTTTNNEIDVAVIGAGISGINAGYRIQEALPQYSYSIFESRHEIGGTWSLFKYPGIRSDSDLYTFGFAFDPWTEGMHIFTTAALHQPEISHPGPQESQLLQLHRSYSIYETCRADMALTSTSNSIMQWSLWTGPLTCRSGRSR